MVAAATMAVAHAHPTLVSHGKTLVTATAVAHRGAISAGHRPRARQETSNHASHVTKCSAKTRAARVLTWATSVTTSTNVNRPAMCLRDSPHPACPRAALVVAAEAAIVVAAEVAIAAQEPETGVVARDRAVVAEVTRVAGFNADQVAKYLPKKLRASFCRVRSNPLWCATLRGFLAIALIAKSAPRVMFRQRGRLFGKGTSQRLHPRVHQLQFARKFA